MAKFYLEFGEVTQWLEVLGARRDNSCGRVPPARASDGGSPFRLVMRMTIGEAGGKWSIGAERTQGEHECYSTYSANAVFAFLMEYGPIEFSGNNAKNAVICLSRKTHFCDRLVLHRIELSLTYGSDDRGSNVDIKYAPDDETRGMALSITANGY